MTYLAAIRIGILNLLIAFLLVTPLSGSILKKENILFKIGRSKDANEIYYQAQVTKDGVLDVKNPINIYWIKFTKGAAIKPLTTIQKTLAYGLKFIRIQPEIAEFQFVSYKKRTFILRKCYDGRFKVFVEINNKEIEVKRIFIQIDGGTFLLPKIAYVELHGVTNENKNMIEIIRP